MKNTTKLFLALTVIACFAFIKPTSTKLKQINIVIDAGHGGTDFGATVDAISEKQIVQQITHKIYALNKDKNVVIHLTRNSDDFVPLLERTNTINAIKPDLVLSLHVNSSKNKFKSGMEIYVSNENESAEASQSIATKLYNAFLKANMPVSEIKNVKLYVLEKSNAPAITVELGFLTNEKDKKLLTDDVEQNRIAETIVAFLSELK